MFLQSWVQDNKYKSSIYLGLNTQDQVKILSWDQDDTVSRLPSLCLCRRQMVEQEIKRELEQEKQSADACDAVNSDAENDEEEYEAWKVRELKRIKRDREERET